MDEDKCRSNSLFCESLSLFAIKFWFMCASFGLWRLFFSSRWCHQHSFWSLLPLNNEHENSPQNSTDYPTYYANCFHFVPTSEKKTFYYCIIKKVNKVFTSRHWESYHRTFSTWVITWLKCILIGWYYSLDYENMLFIRYDRAVRLLSYHNTFILSTKGQMCNSEMK